MNILASLGMFALIGMVAMVGIYIYLSICLSVLAKKTNTPNRGLAWVPLVQVFYMLKIGRRPGTIGLMYFVPLLNLVAFCIAWMSIAEARGKSPWLGAFALFPVLGILIVPWILAAGPDTNPDEMWSGSTSERPTVCQNCKAALAPDDAFCGECGSPVAMVVKAAKARTSAGTMALAAIPIALLMFAIPYFGGNMILGQIFKYQPPARTAANIPGNMASTLSYFPLDQRPNNPSKPQSLTMDNLGRDTTGGTSTPDSALPPGVERTELKQLASSVTTSVYKGAAPVTVNVARTNTNAQTAGEAIAEQVAQATNGTRQGVNTNPPQGQQLTGQRIDGQGKTIFVLWPENDDIVIVIHTTSAGTADAEALAQGVGAGSQGSETALPGTQPGEPGEAVCAFPSEPPANLEMVGIQTITIESAFADVGEPLASTLKQAFGWLLPDSSTNAVYADGENREWRASLFNYGRDDRAWVAMPFIVGSEGGDSAPFEVNGCSGYSINANGTYTAVVQKGPFVVICEAPSGGDPETLKQLVAGFQL